MKVFDNTAIRTQARRAHGCSASLEIEGIPLEAQLEGTILYLRNRDEPGVVGQVGTTLGKHSLFRAYASMRTVLRRTLPIWDGKYPVHNK
jgi:hypothetical protein